MTNWGIICSIGFAQVVQSVILSQINLTPESWSENLELPSRQLAIHLRQEFVTCFFPCIFRTEFACSIGCQELGSQCSAFSFDYSSRKCSIGHVITPPVRATDGVGQSVLINSQDPVLDSLCIELFIC